MEARRPSYEIYDPNRLYAVARLYYEDDRSQSEIAQELKVSRPTVSRMLSQARQAGMVQIRVLHPFENGSTALGEQLREALGLDEVYLAQGLQPHTMGRGMQAPVLAALRDMDLEPGDSLVVSSGMAMHGVAQMDLPALPDVALAPAVGGVAEPEPWHQSNEIVRTMSLKTGSTYNPIFAAAIPSAPMYDALRADEVFGQVRKAWGSAKGALLGVGSPTGGRASISSTIPQDALADSAGDVCLHFFDRQGRELEFPGSERTVRIPREQLRAIPFTTAVAVGTEKADSIAIAARMGLFRRLVTDETTAREILGTAALGAAA